MLPESEQKYFEIHFLANGFFAKAPPRSLTFMRGWKARFCDANESTTPSRQEIQPGLMFFS
jgi:hypothetical protein